MFAAAFFRRRNFHTLHSPVYLCWIGWVFRGFVMLVGAFFRTRYIHTPFCPVYFCMVASRLWQCLGVLLRLCAPFLEPGIFTHLFRPVYFCMVASRLWQCLGVLLCLCAPFRTRHIHTPFCPVYLCYLDSSLACMVASRLWQFVTSRLESSRPAPTWRLVSDRHDPSTFSGVEYTRWSSLPLSLSGTWLPVWRSRQSVTIRDGS